MGAFGAIPVPVYHAIAAGHRGAVSVTVGGTLMSFVPDTTRDAPQVWWTRLGSFVESEGLVTSRHAKGHSGDEDAGVGDHRLNRLRFRDYLPGAKVLVWPTAHSVFIYVRQGLNKREAAAAVGEALKASGRKPLSAAHASIIGLGVAGGVHLPLWVANWPLPRGAVATAGGLFAVTVAGAATVLVLQVPSHSMPGPVGGANVAPVTAQPDTPLNVVPVRHRGAHAAASPSSFTMVDPRVSPQPLPTETSSAKPTPTPVPAPLPSSAPAPLPSSQVPYPAPSGVIGSDSPTAWWLPSDPFPLR